MTQASKKLEMCGAHQSVIWDAWTQLNSRHSSVGHKLDTGSQWTRTYLCRICLRSYLPIRGGRRLSDSGAAMTWRGEILVFAP